MNCLNCKKDMSHLSRTTGHKIIRKFCNRSCAATYNNTRKPKRQAQNPNHCTCGCVIPANHKLCLDCRSTIREKYTLQTISDLKSRYGRNDFHSRIRENSRKIYKDSGKPLACFNCGYDIHVDICHIRDIKDFPVDATLAEVNCIDNLVALDKRCHWEFDNGYLTL